MGLRMTRTRREAFGSLAELSDGVDSLWSARGLCCMTTSPVVEPPIVKHVTAGPSGHLESGDVAKLFDWLWETTRRRVGVVLQLDMSDVASADGRFFRELEFLRRQLRRQGSEVRIANLRKCSSRDVAFEPQR